MSIEKWANYYDKLDSLMSPNEYLIKLLLGNYPNKTSLQVVPGGRNLKILNV